MPTFASTGPLPPDPHSTPRPQQTLSNFWFTEQLLSDSGMKQNQPENVYKPQMCDPTSSATTSASVRVLVPIAALTNATLSGLTQHQPFILQFHSHKSERVSQANNSGACKTGSLGRPRGERMPSPASSACGPFPRLQRTSLQLPLPFSLRLPLPLPLTKTLMTALRTTWKGKVPCAM